MADRNQLKRAVHPDPEHDPFAELTRIMGFDPRIPVSRSQPPAAKPPVSSEPDMSVELEKELMGEFGAAEDKVPAPSAASVAPPADGDFDSTLGDDYDFIFDEAIADGQQDPIVFTAADQSPSAEPDIGLAQRGPTADPMVADEIDRAFVDVDPRNSEIAAAPAIGGDITASMEEAVAETIAEDLAEAVETDAQLDQLPMMPLGAARDFVDPDSQVESFDASEPSFEADAVEESYDLEAELRTLLGRAPVSQPVAEEPAEAEADDPQAISQGDGYFDMDEARPAIFAAGAEATVPALAESEPPTSTSGWISGSDDQDAAAFDDAQADYDGPELEPLARAEPEDPIDAFLAEQGLDGGFSASGFGRPLEPASGPAPILDVEPVVDFDVAAIEAEAHPTVDAALVPAIEAAEIGPSVASYEPDAIDPPVAFDPPVAAPAPEVPSEQSAEPEEDDPFAALAAMVRDIKPSGAPFVAPVAGSSTGSWTSRLLQPSETTAADASASTETSAASTEMPQDGLPGSAAPTTSESANVSTEYQYPTQNRPYARATTNVPDIETVDVPESAVALADDLELPDLDFEEDIPLAADFDDFEAELANAFRQQSAPPATQQAPAVSTHSIPRDSYQNEFSAYQHPAPGAAGAVAATVAAAGATTAYTQVRAAEPLIQAADPMQSGRAVTTDGFDVDDDDLAYDPMLSEDMVLPSDAEAERRPSSRRRLLLAAIIGGVVVIAGIAAYALAGGSGIGGAPAIVRADDDPIKVRPENPGGTTVPNQDNKVFQTMNGEDTAASPAQDKLISGTEEPADVTARVAPPAQPEPADDSAAMAQDDPVAAEIAAAPKSDERIAAVDSDAEAAPGNDMIAVAPRRVRTMVVRPDGSLVPSDAAAPDAAAAPSQSAPAAPALEPADPSQSLAAPTAEEETATVEPADLDATIAPPADAAPAPAAEAAKPATPDADALEALPTPKAEQPAKVAAASGAAVAGGWSMQIASQPSEAAAQSTYDDLAKRYASVIGGKGVNIVKAEIAGKGTFWRVRVPAGTRNDAISLCESYKTAGGNCFVSR